MKRFKLPKIIFFISILFLSPCSLDQYKPQKELTLKVGFKKFSQHLNNSTNPTDKTYVPSFVDRIVLTVKQNDTAIYEGINERVNGDITNEFELPDLNRNLTYNFDVKVYTENYTSDPPKLTHILNQNIDLSGSFFESTQLDLIPQTQSGTVLFNQYISIPATLTSPPDYYPYCLALNKNGEINAAVVKQTDGLVSYRTPLSFKSDNGLKSFDLAPGIDNDPVITNDFSTTYNNSLDCAFLGDEFLLPYVNSAGKSSFLYRSSDTANPIPMSVVPSSVSIYSPSIDSAATRAFIVSAFYDEDIPSDNYYLAVGSYADGFIKPGKFTIKNARSPYVKAVDDENFWLFYLSLSTKVDSVNWDILDLNGNIKNTTPTGIIGNIASTFSAVDSKIQSQGVQYSAFALHTGLINQFAVTLLSKDAPNSQLLIPDLFETNTNRKKHAHAANFGDSEIAVAWLDESEEMNEEYMPKFGIVDNTGHIPIENQIDACLTSGPTPSVCSPDTGYSSIKIVINEEGLGIVSWYSENEGQININRFLF